MRTARKNVIIHRALYLKQFVGYRGSKITTRKIACYDKSALKGY